MKKLLLLTLLAFAFSVNLLAQDGKPAAPKQFMQITTIESVVGGGMGRSKLIVTNPDGSQSESDLNNLFSMAGINFSNIKENEDKILKTLRQYTNDGWKTDQVTSFTLSPSNNGMGIFMTRYLLSKEDVKKPM